jgi:hypothetical protein
MFREGSAPRMMPSMLRTALGWKGPERVGHNLEISILWRTIVGELLAGQALEVKHTFLRMMTTFTAD